MNKLLIIVLVISIVRTFQGQESKTLIKEAIIQELEKYPEERLVDLYKSFFQGYWGPGHLVKDSLSARSYLQQELDTMNETDTVMIHELGCYNRYVRVNLLMIKNGIISFEDLLSLFIISANEERDNSIEEWKREWARVIEVIEEMKLEFVGYESDKKKINELLQQGKYMMHHSEFFEHKYFPHYRVISTRQFEKLRSRLPEYIH